MKEEYFSPENIDKKASELLEKVKNIIPNLKKQEFIPEKSALIIIDMQKYFCSEDSHAFIPSSTAIIPKIKKIINFYKSKKLPVIFTRHVNTQENAGMMLKWWRDIISEDNKLSEIIEEFSPEYLINKTQYDSFYNTELENYLGNNNISQLVITGVMTHLCCEATARSAFARGYETFMPMDATATYNESFHFSSMLNLGHGFSSLVLTEDICN